MRHRKSGRKLRRTASHRKALLSSLATAVLRHKRVTTTVAKAKEARSLVERIITKAKRASVAMGTTDGDAQQKAGRFVKAAGQGRREAARVVRDRAVVSELFSTIAPKVASRPGGYTRIVKLGRRQGDGAELAVLELVDFQAGQERPEKPAETQKEKKPRAEKTKKEGSKTKTAKKTAAASASGKEKEGA
jgi:large subunit ribosomal protein L17